MHMPPLLMFHCLVLYCIVWLSIVQYCVAVKLMLYCIALPCIEFVVQVATLYNLLACDEAEPAQGALSWPVKEELYDLYSLFLAEKEKRGAEASTNGDAQARPAEQRLKELLGIDDAAAKSLQDMVASGGFSLDGAQEEKFVF